MSSTGEYMSRSGKCHLCDVSCERCAGPERDDCTSCPASRFFEDGSCKTFCARGRFAADWQCHLCHYTCHECNAEGPFNCTSCAKDKFGVQRYLLRGVCRTSCPEGSYHSAGWRCEPCAADCTACTGPELCLRCQPGLAPRHGHCLPLQCGDGNVADLKKEECQPCEEGCEECQQNKDGNSATICMSCEDEYYKWGSDCYRFCPERSFGVEDSMVCDHCEDQHCINCDQSQCYWCDEGFSISDGVCVDHCKNGFFRDDGGQECEPCHPSCRTCGGPQYNDCDLCEDGFTLSHGTCLTGGLYPEKHFKNVEQGVSEGCHPSCQTCSGDGKRDCQSCRPGDFMTAQQSCISHCPSATFANQTSGHCQSCPPGCVSCLDPMRCDRCLNDSTSTKLYLQDGRCVAECDRGFLLEEECYPCVPECASCMRNASHCQSCAPQYVLLEASCLGHCPLGFYSTEAHCLPCPTDCRKCSDDGLCQECAEYFFLHQDQCVDDCPGGYFASNQECLRCHGDCVACDGPDSDDCESCRNSKAVRYNRKCLNQCPSNTYYDKFTEECHDCAKSCLTCSGHELFSCLTCETNRRLDETGHCVWYSQCSQHTYMDEKGQCLLCDPLCQRCSGPGKDQCLACTALFLLNHTCVEKCPTGYYGDGKDLACKECHASCLSCVGPHSVECSSCKPGLFRQGHGCVESCSESHYGNTTSGFCEQCEPSCSRCSGPTNHHCLACREEYWYHNQSGRCLKDCPLGYYQDARSKTCRNCHPSCKTCDGAGPLACESCYQGYKLLGALCESECELGFYATSQVSDSASWKHHCEPCDPSCFDCRGPGQSNCTVCRSVQRLSEDARCTPCCGQGTQRGSAGPLPHECCDCHASLVECVPSFNTMPNGSEEGSRAGLWVALCVLLTLAVGGTLFLVLQARSKARLAVRALSAKAGGYERLDGRRGGRATTTPSLGQYSDRIVQCQGRDDEDGEEEEEEEEEENIVYMGQDGTMYRKFRYGLLDEDEEIELEYDDESYSFR